MWSIGKKAKLRKAVALLASYNDKGAYWSGHTEADIAEARDKALIRIRILVERIGEESLPSTFVSAIQSGELANDDTGRYVDLLTEHWAAR